MGKKFDNKDLVKITSEFLARHTHDSVDRFNDKIVLSNNVYNELFKKRFQMDHKALPWERGIVVIKYGERKILRMFHGGSSYGIKKGKVGLTMGSINQLGISVKKDTSFCICIDPAKPCIGKFLFYWQHPVDSVRVAFKGAFYYCVISVVAAVIISILTNIKFNKIYLGGLLQ